MNANKPNVMALASMFFVQNFLAATQDIVVDGWALTMLKRFVFFLIILDTIVLFVFIHMNNNQLKYRVYFKAFFF